MSAPEELRRDIHTMPRHRQIEFAVFALVVLTVIGMLVLWAIR